MVKLPKVRQVTETPIKLGEYHGELLKHVKNVSLLDINKLPSKDEIKDILNKCINISEERKNKMLSLYEQKKDYIKQLQEEKKKTLYKVSQRSKQVIEH